MSDGPYNYSLALNLIEKYSIQPESVVGRGVVSNPSMSHFCRQFGVILTSELRGMEPEALGQIASQGLSASEAVRRGKTSMYAADIAMACMYDVGGDASSSGKNQLVYLAAMALLAEVFDILRQRHKANEENLTARGIVMQMH